LLDGQPSCCKIFSSEPIADSLSGRQQRFIRLSFGIRGGPVAAKKKAAKKAAKKAYSGGKRPPKKH
jgi:hypothetical protein